MDSNDEIVFKKPTISATNESDSTKSCEQNEESDQTDQLSAKEVKAEEVTDNTSAANVSTISKTVLPEPMTGLCPPEDLFFVDQLKNGCIVDHKSVVKCRLVFGRAQDCDVVLEHPSVSRYHAVLLWSPASDADYTSGENRESFWYLVDCGSTHGTTCNKSQVLAGKLIKLIPNNNVFKFGASTRLFSLGSTLEDNDNDSDDETEDIEEDNELKTKDKNKVDNVDSGCDWGINEEEMEANGEETADSKSLQAIIAAMKGTGKGGMETENSNAYSGNPNKCIQQWFEREGYDLEFKCDSIHNKFKCTLDLPIDGQWIPIEGSLKQKKKEAITDACLKSCQLLDKAELLFPWQQQKARALKRKQEEDLDDDTDMIDETIDISKKKTRKQSESNDSPSVETFESLNKKWTELNEELCQMKIKLTRIGAQSEHKEVGDEADDSLDNYMASIGRQKYGLSMSDKIEKSKIKMKINLLTKEQQKLEKLIKLAKPSVELQPIPESKALKTNSTLAKSEVKSDESVKQIPESSQSTVESKPESSQPIVESKPESSQPIVEPKPESSQPIAESEPESNVEKDRKEEIRRKTETIINELKNSSKPKTDSNTKAKHRIKAQSIVEAIEKEKKLEKTKQKASFDSDYVDWLPPSNQSGDGKTPLNERFGY